MAKQLTVAFYRRQMGPEGWSYHIDEDAMSNLLHEQQKELGRLGVRLQIVEDDSQTIGISGYADLLNSIRLRSPSDGISNLCLGHIIGPSPACDLLEDIKRGISRVAFAPEMIQPEDENRRVCHNCGCGC